MPLSPIAFLLGWVCGPLSLALLVVASIVLWTATGGGIGSGFIFGALALGAWSFAGRHLVLAFFPEGEDEPHNARGIAATHVAKDGTRLHTESEGPLHATPILFTHGWGVDATAWYYLRRTLGTRFRLTMWDLPGLGHSERPPHRDYSIDRSAAYLAELIEATKERPVTLVGHGMGGMVLLTLCRRYPVLVARAVKAVVLMNTPGMYPLEMAPRSRAMQAVELNFLAPALHATIVLWPLVWLWTLLAYLNGTAHLVTLFTSFTRRATRGQLDYATRFMLKTNPAVLARGLLAQRAWSESATFSMVPVPVHIVVGDDDIIAPPAAPREWRKAPAGRRLRSFRALPISARSNRARATARSSPKLPCLRGRRRTVPQSRSPGLRMCLRSPRPAPGFRATEPVPRRRADTARPRPSI